jgi:hypothetical protein
MAKTKYGALRVVAALYKIMGSLVIPLGVFGLWWVTTYRHGHFGGWQTNQLVLACVGIIVGGVFMIAFGQLLCVFIDIEHNTRMLLARSGRE